MRELSLPFAVRHHVGTVWTRLGRNLFNQNSVSQRCASRAATKHSKTNCCSTLQELPAGSPGPCKIYGLLGRPGLTLGACKLYRAKMATYPVTLARETKTKSLPPSAPPTTKLGDIHASATPANLELEPNTYGVGQHSIPLCTTCMQRSSEPSKLPSERQHKTDDSTNARNHLGPAMPLLRPPICTTVPPQGMP